VDDPLHGALPLRFHRDDVAVVADGHVAVLEKALSGRPVQDAGVCLLDAFVEVPQLAPHGGQLR